MLIKAIDHIQELQGKLRQSTLIVRDLKMSENQVFDEGLSGEVKMLAEVKPQKQSRREFYRAEEEGIDAGTGEQAADFNVSNITPSMVDDQKAKWDRLKKDNNEKKLGAVGKSHNKAVREQITVTPVIHTPASDAKGSTMLDTQPYPPVTVQPEAPQYQCPPGHHRRSRTVHRRLTVAEKQQLVDQVPDWSKPDNMVGVKIPGVHEPMTGMVKFVGIVQVKGIDQLIAGVKLVSFKLANRFLCVR